MPSSGIYWDLLDVLFTEDDNFKPFIYATFNVLPSMPPFDRREAHHDQTIEPFFSPCKNQAPELLQTFRTNFDPDSTDIVNNDPESPSVFGKRLSYRGDARMSDGQGSHVFRKFRSIEKFDTNLGSTQESWGTATTLYQVFGVLVPQTNGFDGGSFSPQVIERFPSVRYHPYSSDHTSQNQSHTLLISETNPESTLSSTSSLRSSDDNLASVASFISVSSEFSVDVLPCSEGFHRAEFDPRHQEILAQKLNLLIDKVFYYENLRDETIHICPLGCGTEFPGYTIRQHLKKFHKGMSKGPQVQCNRGLLPEGSNIQCSGEKIRALPSFGALSILFGATNPQVQLAPALSTMQCFTPQTYY
ncbi:hypothetical protein EDD18DRAFT_1113045 [Armillaria luteobubalina]|uniref:Uncharacterized protein n=1 Tax=Armillaria luteobubalina TaxID=153913 RepID=A0AA39PCC1_9AGAR|nr:hypothetical protein EDD18DRAFT_1113045 [Armillaria luteobubalina]